MKNQRLLFQQKAHWDWVADRVGTPDISAWKPDKHKGGPERNKAGTRNPQNLLMIWVNIWLNTMSFGQPRHVSVSRAVCVIFSHQRGDHWWHWGRKTCSHRIWYVFCISGVLKCCLPKQHPIHSSPGSAQSSEGVSWWVFQLLQRKQHHWWVSGVPQSGQGGWHISPAGSHSRWVQAGVNGSIMISTSLTTLAAVSLIPWTAGKV